MAGRLRAALGARVPYTRKAFHFTIFTFAAVVQAVWGGPGVVVFGAVVALFVLHAVWRGEGHAVYDTLARPADAPHARLFIIAPLITTAVGGVAANLLFGDLALVGYLVAGWGDAAGEPVGVRWGRHRYRVPSMAGVRATRSAEGSAAVALAGSAAVVLAMVLMGADVRTATRIAIVAGLAGALVEAVSPHGLDNFTVQLAASGAALLVV